MSKASHAAFWADPPSRDRHVAGLLAIYREMLEARDGAGSDVASPPPLRRSRKAA
jgi:hypothetical protein